jgi:hypothetical protein
MAITGAVSAAVIGASATAYSVHEQQNAAKEAEANQPKPPPNPAVQGAQSTQATLNAAQSLNAQAGSFLGNPAVHGPQPGGQKSTLG